MPLDNSKEASEALFAVAEEAQTPNSSKRSSKTPYTMNVLIIDQLAVAVLGEETWSSG